MTALKLRKWDSAEHLKTEEDMALCGEACLQEAGDDAAFMAKALGRIARAKGMSQLSRERAWAGEPAQSVVRRGQPQFCQDFEGDECIGHQAARTADACGLNPG